MSSGPFLLTTTTVRGDAFVLGAPKLAPSDNQPVVVMPASKHRDAYLRADAVMTAFEEQMKAATDAVGHDTAHAARVLKTGRLVSWGVGAAILAGITAAGIASDAYWFESLIAGAVAGGALLGIGRSASRITSERLNRAHAETPLGGTKLDGVRALNGPEDGPIEIAALAIAARQWTEIIKERRIHGWEAGEILGELSRRTKEISTADFGRVTRWSAVRKVLADYAERWSTDEEQLEQVYEAFTALRADERHELAPIVLEELFDDENPRNQGWAFTESYELYEYLRTTAERDPADAPPDPRVVRARSEQDDDVYGRRAKKRRARKDDEESAEGGENVEAKPVAPAGQNVIVQDSNTIVSLDATLAAFEAELTLLKKKKQVTADCAAKAMAIATAPERTPVETVALGLRAKRFIGELDAKEIYGYDVRQQMQQLATKGAEIGPALGDQIRRIDAFFAVLKSFSPKRQIHSDETDRIIACVKDLLPCDRRVGAERALACYFNNAAPRAEMDYGDSQRLALELRALMRS